MKFFTLLTMATAACAATMHASHAKRHPKRHARRHAKHQCGAGGAPGGAPGAGAPAPIFSEGGGVELVGFTGANVVASGGACLDGHDERAQVTVDVAGNDCAVFTPTVVTPTAP
ncbi:Flavohemoprotein [Verticillium dahliae VDG2]|nr:Flavohemoprotein [Verticillium dahliae VDG2]